MAVTRINNNQITDASAGNVYLGINANTKLQNYSITSNKLANSLVYGSDLTVSGNLTVNGTSTAIDTTITTIEDPVIVLASTQTGSPTVDIGFLGERGTANNIAFVWNEANSEFVTAFTDTSETSTTISIIGYANLHTNNMVVGGTTSLAGNVIGATQFTGNVTGGNLLTPGLISVTGNVTAANFIGNISGNLTSPGANTQVIFNDSGVANAVSGFTFDKTSNLVTVGGNVNATNFNGNVYGTSVSASGTVTAASTVGGVITGSSSSVTGTQTAASTVGGVITGSSSSVTGTQTAASTVGGVITGSSVSVTGTATAASTVGGVITGSSSSVTGSQTAASTVGGVITGSSVSVTGNVTGGNLVSATVTNPTAMTVSTNAGNINLEPTGNIVVNNTYINGLQLLPVQNQDAASKYYVDQTVTTGITIHEAVYAATNTTLASATGGTISYTQPNGVSNGIGAYIQTTGTFTTIDTANVQTVGTRILVKNEANAVFNGIYVYSNATAITRSTDADQYGAGSTEEISYNDYFFTTNGNVNAGTAFIVNAPTGTITFGTSNIGFGIFSQSQVYTANTSAGLVLNGTVFSAKVDDNTTAFDGLGNISVKAGANLTTPNIGAATGTSLSVTGTVTAASTVGGVITGSTASLSGNVTGGNLLTSGSGGAISGTGNITGGNILTGGNVSATGNVMAAWLIGNIQGSVTSPGANTDILFNDGGVANATGGFTFDKTSNLVTVGGNVNATNFNGNVYGTSVSASGTVTAASTVGGVITGTSTSVTGTQTAASTVGGVITGTSVSVTGDVTSANLSLTGGNIDSSASAITINGASADVNFAVNGDTTTAFFVDAGTGTASFGSATQTTNAIVAFNSTNSILSPVGNTAQRPATGVTGMLRFNSTTNSLEIYDNSAWSSVGVPVFTVIDDQQFYGDGANVNFTLSSTQTTNSCIVSINGVVQIPTLAYAVAGTDPTCVLTFTEAPAVGDIIDVREITTTTTVTSIANSSGNAVVAVSATTAQVNVTGDLSVSGTILGGNINSTAITSGTSNMAIVSSGGNIRGNVAGTTVMTISPGLVDIVGNLTVSGNATLSGNILGDRIQNGTTSFDIQTPNGNANVNIGGTGNLAVFSPGALNMTGNITPTANITYDLGTTTNRWKDLWLSNSTIYMGNAQISANATSLIFTNPAGGQTVLAGATAGITGATVSASGNITGGNILTGGIVSATGNITGSYILGNGSQLTGIDATSIQNGTSSVSVIASGGNVRANVGGATITTTYASGLAVTGLVSATGTITGASVVGGVMTGSSVSVTGAVTGASVVGGVMTGTSLSVSGTVTGASHVGSVVSVTGAVTGASVVGGVMTGTSLSVSGTVTGGNVTTAGQLTVNSSGNAIAIINGSTDGIGNIGTSGDGFNTVFAKATSAQYADLAEKYTADAAYAPGTVVVFGGTHEVTVNATDADRKVAGVVSTNPAYIMNDRLDSEFTATVALTGRVPTMVVGTVRKGDLMVAAGLGRARAEADPKVGTVIGKALEDFDGAEGTIEVVVGRF